MKILYRGIFIAIFKRTYIQHQARPIIVTSLLSYETSPYFSWREKSLLPKFLSQLEPCTKLADSENQKKKVTKWERKSIHLHVLVWDKEIPPSDQNNFGRNLVEPRFWRIILVLWWNFLVPHQYIWRILLSSPCFIVSCGKYLKILTPEKLL